MTYGNWLMAHWHMVLVSVVREKGLRQRRIQRGLPRGFQRLVTGFLIEPVDKPISHSELSIRQLLFPDAFNHPVTLGQGIQCLLHILRTEVQRPCKDSRVEFTSLDAGGNEPLPMRLVQAL